MKDVY
jgi:DNA polymerase alpha subunit A